MLLKLCTIELLFILFSYFYITPTASYGNCLSFNYAANTELDPLAGERYSSKTGPFFGLSMVLNLEQRYYIGGGITQAAGARFVITENNRPLIDENGHDLMPNTLTEVAMQVSVKWVVEFLNRGLQN